VLGTEFNDANLLFLGGLPTALLWLLGVAAAGILVFTWLDLKALRRSRRVLLIALRTSVVVLALAMLLEPALELRHVTRIKNNVIVLVDDSLSMTLPDSGDTSRWQRAQAFVEDATDYLTEPNEEHRFQVFSFNEELASTSAADLLQHERPTGPSTRILEALQSVSELFPRR